MSLEMSTPRLARATQAARPDLGVAGSPATARDARPPALPARAGDLRLLRRQTSAAAAVVSDGMAVDNHLGPCAELPRSVATCRQRKAPQLRFWLAPSARFAHAAIDLDLEQGLFSLLCFREPAPGQLELVTSPSARYRLRELEATLIELELELPTTLRLFFVAFLGDDALSLARLTPRVRSLICCESIASSSVA
jgi:hypothetical protein